MFSICKLGRMKPRKVNNVRDVVSGKASILNSSVVLQSFSGPRASSESTYQSVSTREAETITQVCWPNQTLLGDQPAGPQLATWL